MLFLGVYFAHADSIAALVVDQDEAVVALAADAAEDVANAVGYIHVALALVEVVVVLASEAGSSVPSALLAGDQGGLAVDQSQPSHQEDQAESHKGAFHWLFKYTVLPALV